MTVRTVAFGSPEQKAAIELRREVLRRPLGLDFTLDELAKESGDAHLVLLDGADVVACLVLAPQDPMTLKMRQVAVHPDRQGGGLGRRLVQASEAWAAEHYFRRMVLHARETAVPFYLALGYSAEGEPFEEVGIPHRAMFKNL